MKKSILFLTDLTNKNVEDPITIEHLKQFFDVTVSYFEDIEQIENNFDLIISRNVWPSVDSKYKLYNKLKREFLQRAIDKKLKIYNDVHACADRFGKDYLIDLYNKKFPVIPCIDSLDDLDKLPQSEEYLIKPKDGFSAYGIKTVKFSDLQKLKSLKNQFIQPKLKFENELSFYFVDDKLIYALMFVPAKVPDYPFPIVYKATKEDIEFTKKFLKWNKMKTGVCRIDALRLYDGKLTLIEVEDDAPHFSIGLIPEKLRNKFLSEFTKSVKKHIDKL